ncbi:DUF5677 domain-containing protein [Chloroflexota bacterium]
MPTEPNEHVLNRISDIERAKPMIDIASPVLREAINYGTRLYERCRNTSKASTDEAFPVLALYLHIIQMVDSIEVLVFNSCVEPAQLLLRSAFEARLSLDFMVEKLQRSRAIAWIIRNIQDQIEFGQRYSKDHIKGKDFFETLVKEGFDKTSVSLPPMPPLPEISEEYFEKLKNVIEKPEYADVNKEYKRLTKNRQRVEWYSLFDGPQNIRELAEYLEQRTVYDILYRKWSKLTHMANPDHLTLRMEDGMSVLGPIRNPLRIVTISTNALGMLLEASQLMIKQFRSGDLRDFLRWWREEIQEKHETLVSLEISHLGWYEKTFIKKEKDTKD